MRFTKRSLPSIIFLVVVSLSLAVPYVAAQSGAPKEKVLFGFPASGDLGTSPNGVLISDAAGNFYGVNSNGAFGSGAVYEISPTAEGSWTAKPIYVFPTNTYFPGSLVMDSSGNLFGAIYGGGMAPVAGRKRPYGMPAKRKAGGPGAWPWMQPEICMAAPFGPGQEKAEQCLNYSVRARAGLTLFCTPLANRALKLAQRQMARWFSIRRATSTARQPKAVRISVEPFLS